MELNNLQFRKQISRGSLSDPKEKARVLRHYAGIFPNDIPKYASTFIKAKKIRKNYSK